MLGHFFLSHEEPNRSNNPSEPNEPNDSFWNWLKRHTWGLLSQVVVFVSALGFIFSFFYYATHGEYFEYLKPRYIQDGILIFHIIVLIVFIGAMILIKDADISDEKARKTFRRLFGREIKSSEADHSRKQLEKFRKKFFLFWVIMGCLYLGFLAQRYFLPPTVEISKEEVFREVKDIQLIDENSKGKENSAISDDFLKKEINDLNKAVNNSSDAEIITRDYQIYSGIKSLENINLKDRITEIINQLKDEKVDRALKHNDESIVQPAQAKTKSKGSIANQNLNQHETAKYEQIYALIWASFVTQDSERAKNLVEQAKEKIAPLMQNNPLNDQEKIIFAQINNLNTNELIDRITEIKRLADKSENFSENPANSNSRKILSKISYAVITYILNTLGLWMIFVCYIYTTTMTSERESLKKEQRRINISLLGLFILSISSLLLFSRYFSGASETELTQWIVFFDGLSGILNAVALALLLARLDSKLIGLQPILVGVLYFYAAFQPLFVVFEQPGEISQLIKTVVLVAVFISKIYFFLVITFAIQTGRLLTYLYCYPNLSKRVDTIFANPFIIYCFEESDEFTISIKKYNKEKYAGTYKSSDIDEETFFRKIDELREVVKDENGIKIIETHTDKFEIKIIGEDNEPICETIELSMTKDKAEKLRDESIRNIPYCEVIYINKGKDIHTVKGENIAERLQASISDQKPDGKNTAK